MQGKYILGGREKRNKKEWELINLTGSVGCYEASIYNLECNYFNWITFYDYSKKEIFRKLQNEYNCKVARGF